MAFFIITSHLFINEQNFSIFECINKYFDFKQKTSKYYCVEWKIEQKSFLNIHKKFKNNVFRAFFVKKLKFLD